MGACGKPTLEAYAEAKRFNEAKRQAKRAAVEKLSREGLPPKVVAKRVPCTPKYAAQVRKELGLPPPSPDWESA